MSTRCERTPNRAMRVDDFFAVDTAYTVGFWVYVVSRPPSDYATLHSLYYDPEDYHGVHIRIDSSGVLEIHTDWDAGTSSGSTLSNSTWYYIWMRRDGTGGGASWNLYLDGSTTPDITRTQSMSGGDMAFGREERDNTRYAEIRVLNPKFWNTDKAASLANAEKVTCEHQSASGAYSEYNLSVHTDLTDQGPGSRDLSAVGSLSTEADEGSWTCGAEPRVPVPIIQSRAVQRASVF